MVQDRNIEQIAAVFELLCDPAISFTWPGLSGGMIMSQDNGAGIRFYGILEDDPDVCYCPGDSPGGDSCDSQNFV